ncbi:MAG: hypothetical protein E7111_02465 [Bacteroidales bacterium]|nr:hypothetical protein [Bacteroidales bacterium]
MKKTLSLVTVLVLAVTACSPVKKAAKTVVPAQTDLVEQVLPLSEAKYHSDAQYYRAVQSGVSPERSMAKKIAIQNARQELAATIQSDIKTVTENYAKQMNLSSDQVPGYESRMTELTYSVVSQTLTGATVIEEKLYTEPNGTFRHYVCMELSKEEMKEAVLAKLKNDEKLLSDFNLSEFKKLYDQKMAEFTAQQ